MRKSISTAFFSMVSTLMVLGIVLMGCSEWVLFKNYFAKDRYETLDQVVNVAKRTAEYLVNSETMPQGAERDALNTKLPKTKQREIEPFSAWELDQLRKSLSPSPNHKDAGILLSANGGLRLGEVCALRVSDIDFQNGTVSIERAVQRVRQNGKTKLIIQTPKSEKSVRVIPLPNDMMAYLKKAVSGLSQNAYILTGRTDKPMEPRTYQYYFESVLRRCGIRKRSYHTLRHTYATRCIENGIDVKSVSEMLGHADVTTTLRLYVHPSLDSKRQVIQKISFLGGVA